MAELRMPAGAPPPTEPIDHDILAVLLPDSGQREIVLLSLARDELSA